MTGAMMTGRTWLAAGWGLADATNPDAANGLIFLAAATGTFQSGRSGRGTFGVPANAELAPRQQIAVVANRPALKGEQKA